MANKDYLELGSNPDKLKGKPITLKPLKKFTPKGKLPKFNEEKSKYPKLNLGKDSYTPKSKVPIVKKLPRTNLQYPKMTDIFDVQEPKMKMALDLAINPTDNADEVANFLDDFGVWMEEQVERKFATI